AALLETLGGGLRPPSEPPPRNRLRGQSRRSIHEYALRVVRSPLTLSLSPGEGEGIEMAPSPSERERVGVRARVCSRIIRTNIAHLASALPQLSRPQRRPLHGVDEGPAHPTFLQRRN